VFNGTVVYETGPVQWGGAVYFLIAAVLLGRKLLACLTRPSPPAYD
jgi:hypothetical protein